MDDTGDITLDQRYADADADVWCEWALTVCSELVDALREFLLVILHFLHQLVQSLLL